MIPTTPNSTGAQWARFRFSVVGSLLSCPPAPGSLKTAIHSLAEKTWSHPVTGRVFRVAAGTIARWYYTALRQPDDPVAALRRALRKDCGKISLAAALAERLHLQCRDHPDWSYQLRHRTESERWANFIGSGWTRWHCILRNWKILVPLSIGCILLSVSLSLP